MYFHSFFFFDNDWNIENNNRFIDNSFSEEDLSIRHNTDFHFDDYGQIKLFQEPKREDIFISNPSKMAEDNNNFNINFSFEKTTIITSKIPRFETKIEKKTLGRKKMNENTNDKGKIESNVDMSLFFKLSSINYEMFSKMIKEQNKKNTIDPQVKIIGLSEYLLENNKE